MNTKFLLGGLILGLALLAQGATNDATTALQKGLFEEEANHDLGAAIRAYQAVVAQFDKDRKLAGTAVFRLGECYRKQGQTNEAAAQYERVLREFADQGPLVTLSRQSLAAFGGAAASAAAPALSSDARKEQKKLLDQEIKLVQQKLDALRKKQQVGIDSQEAIWAAEQEILQLKRQSAALDAGQKELLDLSVPATSAETEEVKRIQAMIKDSPDLINAKEQGGNTPLHAAASRGQLVVAQFLLANGADVAAENSSGSTPLHLAALSGHRAMVELLLEHKAPVLAPDANGDTPLHLAAGKGYRTVVEVLLARGADVNAKNQGGTTPLHAAATSGARSVAEVLLARGANINAVCTFAKPMGSRTFTGTALHIAAERGDVAMTELLLDSKADTGILDKDGLTALQVAAKTGRAGVVAALLAHGADVNARNTHDRERGWTALHYAVMAEQKEIVSLLLTNGADVNARMETFYGDNYQGKGWTALHMATRRGMEAIIKSLLAFKADPNVTTDTTNTSPLFCALWLNTESAQRQSLVVALLDHGANVDFRLADGMTPLMAAASRRDKDLIELLLAHHAKVNAQDLYGRTPLFYLVSNPASQADDPIPAAKLLLAAGADPNLRENGGLTPLTYLTSKHPVNWMDLSELLRQHGALDNLPDPDRIQICRPVSRFTSTIFKGPNEWSQFTLLDLLAVQFDFLGAAPQGEPGSMDAIRAWAEQNRIAFPDLAHVQIRRPGPDFKSWRELSADLSGLLESGDCSKNIPLQWGDVVEVPEADHVLNARWSGFSTNELINLKKCLTRAVSITIKGQTTNLTLEPSISLAKRVVLGPRPGNPATIGPTSTMLVPEIMTKTPFWLKPVLLRSNLLLASSDLSHVKVTRTNPANGEKKEWIVDCSDSKPAPAFWLCDGDAIEVPDRP